MTLNPIQPTYGQVWQRYAQHRQNAYDDVEQQIAVLSRRTVHVGPISRAALDARDVQWDPLFPRPDGHGNFPWRRHMRTFRHHPDRLEMALWSNATLCGLALGKPSRRRTAMSLYFLEGSPDSGHPLRGMVLTAGLAMLEAYALAFLPRVNSLRLISPVPTMISTYAALGYSSVTDKFGTVTRMERSFPP